MEDKPDYSYDTDAMRDVANTDLQAIIEDIEESRSVFGGLGDAAAQAFHSPSSAFSALLSPFAPIQRKWEQASTSLTTGMVTSQTRVEEASTALLQTADDYDDVDTRSAADFHRLLYGRQN